MKFRPCIDIHNGRVKQIIGSTLNDGDSSAETNFTSDMPASFFAEMYKKDGLYGGHIIILNKKGTAEYEASYKQAASALQTFRDGMQIGGGITDENAADFLNAGASHVIVTSFIFQNGEVNQNNLNKLSAKIKKENIVLDLSCRKKDDGFYIVTDRWQKFTNVKITREALDFFAAYCGEFLVHAVDAEGRQNGIEAELASLLGEWGKIPVTYAGGVGSYDDLKILHNAGGGKLDVTVGSALDIFGGKLKYTDVIDMCKSIK